MNGTDVAPTLPNCQADPSVRPPRAWTLLIVLLDSDVEVGARFRNHCASSTRVGGHSRPPALWSCYNPELGARRRQPRFVTEQVRALVVERLAVGEEQVFC